MLNSKNHGVPQNRGRVFIVGHLRVTPRPEVFPFSENGEETPERGVHTGTLTSRYPASQREGTYIEENGDQKGEIEQINKPKHSNDRVYGTGGISPTLNTMQGGNRQPFVKISEAARKGDAESTESDNINLSVPDSKARGGVGKRVAQTIGLGLQQHALPNPQIRRLTPLECERLQGFPDYWTQGLSDTQRYKTLGNAVTVNVIQHIADLLLGKF